MKYEAIALDLDGTLTNSRREVTQRTKKAVIAAAKDGCAVILATGRPVPGVKKIARDLELKKYGGYILSYNGGEIWSCGRGAALRRTTVDVAFYHTICHIARKYNVTAMTYDKKGVITENPEDPYVKKEAAINQIPIRRVDRLDMEAANDPVMKFLIVGDPKDLKAPYEEIQRKLSGDVNAFFSEPYFLEITPNGIEKASALAVLLEEIGVERERLIACGDGYNDIPMLQFAGLSVAMENAYDEVKEFADIITDTNDSDGVAKVIEKYILHTRNS
jgi:Cof subfamily protein (haloacid dehalogenase superfamily)